MPKPNRGGRPSKLTPDVHRDVVERVRAGAFPWVAAQAAGIAPRTFYRWMADGEAGRRQFRQFWQDVRAAAAEARASAEAEVRRKARSAGSATAPGGNDQASPDGPSRARSMPR